MAKVDMFLKLDGVEGESPDPQHPSEIQIEAFSISVASPRDAFTNQAQGANVWGHMFLKAKVDKSTPKLFMKIAKNEKIPSAVLTCRKSGGEQFEYFKVTLSEVLVVGVTAGEIEGEEVVPPCKFQLAYAKIEISAKEQVSTGPTSGPVVFVHNLATNR